MTVRIAPPPLQQFFVGGLVANNYRLFTYAAGTANKLATYTDAGGGTPNTNPIILDSNGSCNLWLTQGSAYKFVLAPPTDTDPPTNAVWTRDQIYGVNDSVNVLAVASALGTADALIASFSPAITALTNNTVVYLKATYANLTTTPTFTPNNGVILPATIVKGNNLPLVAGDIQPNYWLEMIWNSTWGKWVLVNPATGIGASLVSPVTALTTTYSIVAADVGKTFSCSGTFSATLPDSATTQNGFSGFIRNDGAGVITLAAAGANTINGAASITLRPGNYVTYVNRADGTWAAFLWFSSTDYQVFTANGTWTKPSGLTGNERVTVEMWGGGGGSGGVTGNANAGGSGGGGGGDYNSYTFLASLLGATETVTIGAAGIAGTYNSAGGAGGTTSFGAWLSAFGGGASDAVTVLAQGSGSGGGGGLSSVGGAGSTSGTGGTGGTAPGYAGAAAGANAAISWCGGGGGAGGTSSNGSAGGHSQYGGGGGGGGAGGGSGKNGGDGGKSIYGGGGGAGGGGNTGGLAGAAGTSMFGGNGGAAGSPGTAPGGGAGGITSTASNTPGQPGARGECRVWVVRS